jgi:hypothetical protein
MKPFLHKKVEDAIASGGDNDLRTKLVQGMIVRWPDHEKLNVFAMASLIDPRFKRYAFTSKEAFRKAFDEVVDRMVCEITTTEPVLLNPQPSTSISTVTADKRVRHDTAGQRGTIASTSASSVVSQASLWGTFRDMVAAAAEGQQHEPPRERMERELHCFLQEPDIIQEKSAYKCWASSASRFPFIAKVARKYQSVPATSVPNEQLLSMSGQIISERRNRLKPYHVEHLVFLCHNLRLTVTDSKLRLTYDNVKQKYSLELQNNLISILFVSVAWYCYVLLFLYFHGDKASA